MLYEIGDPQAYILPDVICDFSNVSLKEIEKNIVQISGARGYPCPKDYKVSVTYADGYRGGHLCSFIGIDADKKLRYLARQFLKDQKQ